MINKPDKPLRMFNLHAEHGIPLGMQMMILSEKGLDPRKGLANFFFDAMHEGWCPDKCMDMIEGAARDNALEFSRDELNEGIRSIGSVMYAQGFRDNELWKACADSCQYLTGGSTIKFHTKPVNVLPSALHNQGETPCLPQLLLSC